MIKKDEWLKIVGDAELPQYFYVQLKGFIETFLNEKNGENGRIYRKYKFKKLKKNFFRKKIFLVVRNANSK